MRKLITGDVPAFCRLLKKTGLKEELRGLVKSAEGRDVEDVGYDAIWKIFDVITEAEGEGELYRFLAGPFEMQPEEIPEIELPDFIARMKRLIEENDLTVFFRSAAALMK